VLARACNVTKAVEIGTLGGYSGVCLLRGMPATGRLWTFELHDSHAAVARESFKRAGVASRAQVIVGPALDRLAMIEREGPFDLVFVDADKESYPDYADVAAGPLRVAAVILGDNAFLFGEVIKDPTSPEAKSDALRISRMREFHDKLVRGGRFRSTMLPTGEGLALGVKVR